MVWRVRLVRESAAEAGVLSRGERRAEATGHGSALVERARRGDVEAFDELYRVHRDRVYTLCSDLCGNRELAEDLLQETFVRTWRGLRRFGGRSSFATWVHRIAINVCRDAARKARRQGPHPPAPSPSPSTTLGVNLERGSVEGSANVLGPDVAVVERVRATLAGLKPAFRSALVLRHTLGLSYEEIGETLGWSLAKVKVTIHRAKRAFKDAYGEGVER
jgi:RNA polymerase sigma-70 factor (ECF subfamily)